MTKKTKEKQVISKEIQDKIESLEKDLRYEASQRNTLETILKVESEKVNNLRKEKEDKRNRGVSLL